MKFKNKEQEDLFNMIKIMPLNVAFTLKDLKEIYSQCPTQTTSKELIKNTNS